MKNEENPNNQTSEEDVPQKVADLFGALFATLPNKDSDYLSRQKEITDQLFKALDSLSPAERNAEINLLNRNLDRRYSVSLYNIRDLIKAKRCEEALTQIAPLENMLLLLEDAINKRHQYQLVFRYYFSLMEKALTEKAFPEANITLLPVDGVSLYILKAQALFRLGKTDQGYLSLHQALELDPVSVDVVFLLLEQDIQANNDFSIANDEERISQYLYRSEDFFRSMKYVAYLTYNTTDKDWTSYLSSLPKNITPYDFLYKADPLLSILLPKEKALLSPLVKETYEEKIKEAIDHKDKATYLYYLNNYLPFLSPEEKRRFTPSPFALPEVKKEKQA